MWSNLASFILRNRNAILVVLAIATAFMGWQATQVKMSYKFAGLLPQNDSAYIEYENFIEQFSEDGNVLVIGVNDERLFSVENYRQWYTLGKTLKNTQVPKDTVIDGLAQTIQKSAADSVFSIAHCYTIVKNEEERRFAFERIQKSMPETQEEVDSLVQAVRNLPFYEGLLYSDTTNATLMMVFMNAALFNSEDRGQSVEEMTALIDEFSEETGIQAHISGLPYIRTEMTNKVRSELGFFVLFAAAVTALLLFIFFRNLGVVAVCMLVVGIGVVFSLGTISLFGYSISMLMGLIPPLMIVIGVPNCIYLLNKYHSEYKRHGNKAKSLTRVVQKVGNATFMTNTTTAMGFATFIFTHSDILRQFGVIASINILAIFIISIITIPTIFSFLPAPMRRHTRHLVRNWLDVMVECLLRIVQEKRRPVYIITVVVILTSIYGLTRIETTGNIVGDFPSQDRVIKDLEWFEDNFAGVMPFEILVDGKKPGQIVKSHNLSRIEKLQKLLKEYPEFSRSLSIVDATKFARQAFYNG
ncbi:MAG: MMPL family transporter, partial [Flavobacteriales bacterium]|nr:MMPL family transporter [Flavobacteriales bacterium]